MVINIKTFKRTTYIPSMNNRVPFAVVSTSGYTKLRVTQSTTRAFKIYMY